MMKVRIFACTCLSLLYTVIVSGQSTVSGAATNSKPPIDESVYGTWPQLIQRPVLSNDGHFVMYPVDNMPVGKATLFVKGIKNNFDSQLVVPKVFAFRFTSDSKRVIFKIPGDSLGLMDLKTGTVQYLEHVSSFFLPTGDSTWLVYKLKNEEQELVLLDLLTRQQKRFAFVKNYLLSPDGDVLIILQEEKESQEQQLSWIDLEADRSKVIWKGSQAEGFRLDGNSTQLAFTVTRKDGKAVSRSLWYYGKGEEVARQLAGDSSEGLGQNTSISRIEGFSNDGRMLFFDVMELAPPAPPADAVMVNVWSYRDPKLQSQQLAEIGPHSYLCVAHIKDKRIYQLQKENDVVLSQLPMYGEGSDKYVLLLNHKGNGEERSWNITGEPNLYLTSLENGNRKLLKKDCQAFNSYQVSPTGKYAVYLDEQTKNYNCYNISTGTIYPITNKVSITRQMTADVRPMELDGYFSIAGWTQGDKAVLLYDEFDIWLVDMTAKTAPQNLTNGYGRKSNIVFRFAMDDYSKFSLHGGQQLLLTAINRTTKDNGFYQLTLSGNANPVLLTTGPCLYSIEDNQVFSKVFPPLKARNNNFYVIRRESASQYPNYFATTDFKNFTAISDIHPESSVNWMSSELHNWKDETGMLRQGVLYKPENFDTARKYPVIFLYYEKLSHELNVFRMPEASDARIDIPSFVSNGYLVFTPDIYYTPGKVGESALKSVESAADHLSSLPFIDPKRMGLQGHSFGGYETNYIITHSSRFAAACASAGMTDLISDYGSLWGGTQVSKYNYYEYSQVRMMNSLWKDPEMYIRNSPILYADKVTTPLLMMHNDRDGAVPFTQGLEFFIALRRLGKRVWMLQYDKGDHHLDDQNALDYHHRLLQFFDHYLKDMPPPLWMTKGIPAKDKGIVNGFEYDTSEKTPGKGLTEGSSVSGGGKKLSPNKL